MLRIEKCHLVELQLSLCSMLRDLSCTYLKKSCQIVVTNMLGYSKLCANFHPASLFVRFSFNLVCEKIRGGCEVSYSAFFNSSHAFFSNIAHLQHQISPSLVSLSVFPSNIGVNSYICSRYVLPLPSPLCTSTSFSSSPSYPFRQRKCSNLKV